MPSAREPEPLPDQVARSRAPPEGADRSTVHEPVDPVCVRGHPDEHTWRPKTSGKEADR